MKKVLSRAVLCALLTLAVFFTACKSPSSGGGGNPGGGYNPPEKQIPLTLEAIADGEITFNYLSYIAGLKYKINDSDPVAITENSGSKSIQVSAGDVVSLFAQGTYNTSGASTTFRINCSSDCYIYGNVMSLLTDDYQTATTITRESAFAFLFYDNAHIKNHPEKEIVLPATTLKDYCYNGMFAQCISLTKAPDLPATTLVTGCYKQMFRGCESLTSAPALLTPTLADYCYYSMFNGCTSLTTAPSLPATTLTNYCYRNMFSDCVKLNKVECLATDISAEYCTTSWLEGVPSSGTFIKASGMNDWTSDGNGIPSDWTVETK